MEPTLQVFTEVFPITPAALPPLTAYTLHIRGANGSAIGGKLAYRLKKEWGGALGLDRTPVAHRYPQRHRRDHARRGDALGGTTGSV